MGDLLFGSSGRWPQIVGKMSGEKMVEVHVLWVLPVRWSPEFHQLLKYVGCRFPFEASLLGQ